MLLTKLRALLSALSRVGGATFGDCVTTSVAFVPSSFLLLVVRHLLLPSHGSDGRRRSCPPVPPRNVDLAPALQARLVQTILDLGSLLLVRPSSDARSP